MKHISSYTAAIAAAFLFFASPGASAKPPFSQVHNKPVPAQAETPAEDNGGEPEQGLLQAPSGAKWYLEELKTASDAVKKLNDDGQTLYRDQAQLITRVENVRDFLDTSSNRLGLLETIDSSLKKTEKSLRALDKAAAAAEAIPQARAKAKNLRSSLDATLKKVTAARVRMDAVVAKTKPARIKLENAAAKADKLRLALWGVNEGVLAKMPIALGAASYCVRQIPDEKRPCAQQKVDDKCSAVNPAVADYDRVVKVLIFTPEPWLPSMSFFNPFSAELDELERLREEVDALLSRVEKLEGEMRGLLRLLDMKFGFSFPYPNPSWTNPARISHYHVSVSFSKIVEGVNAIEREIEHILSGFLWKVLKKLGVGKYINDLKNQAEHEANRMLKAVHFDIDLGLPDFSPLDPFEKSIAGLPGAIDLLKFPSFDTSLPGFGLPGITPDLSLGDIENSLKFFSPNGLLPNMPRPCDGVRYGCN